MTFRSVLVVTSLLFSSTSAYAWYDAEILSMWANPDPAEPRTDIQLCARILNTTTEDTDYGGEATFIMELEVDIPDQWSDDEPETRQAFGVRQTRTICIAYRTHGEGEYVVDVHVESLDLEWDFDQDRFSFTVEEDPCADVVCNDYCDGNDRVWGQSCEDGDCVGGSRTDCDDHDVSYARATYCNGSELRSSIPGIDYSCGGSQCNGACTESGRRSEGGCGTGSWGNWSYWCEGDARVGE